MQKIKGNKPRQVKVNYGQTREEDTKNAESCLICMKTHKDGTCPLLEKMDLNKRFEITKTKKVCRKCFKKNHFPKKCETQIKCGICQGNHNTLLHVEKPAINPNSANEARQIVQVNMCEARKEIILATALVRVVRPQQAPIELRALIDPGSQATFVSKAMANILRLEKAPTSTKVVGIGSTNAGLTQFGATLTIRPSHTSGFKLDIYALILPKLTNLLPSRDIESQWEQRWPSTEN